MSAPDRQSYLRPSEANTHLGFHGDLFTISPAESVLGHEVLEGLHDGSGLGFLVVGEDAGDGDDSSEDNSEVEIVIWRLLISRGLDTVGHEAEDSSDPEQTGEPGEQILTELDPLRSGWRRSQLVKAVLLIAKFCLFAGQTILDVCIKPFQKIRNFHFVDIKLELFLKIFRLLIFFSCEERWKLLTCLDKMFLSLIYNFVEEAINIW